MVLLRLVSFLLAASLLLLISKVLHYNVFFFLQPLSLQMLEFLLVLTSLLLLYFLLLSASLLLFFSWHSFGCWIPCCGWSPFYGWFDILLLRPCRCDVRIVDFSAIAVVPLIFLASLLLANPLLLFFRLFLLIKLVLQIRNTLMRIWIRILLVTSGS